MYAAYDGLDQATKDEIDGLQAVHDFTQTFGHTMSDEERQKAQEQYPPVRHPVVCTHPATGKLHLYVNRPFVSHIEGLDRAASLRCSTACAGKPTPPSTSAASPGRKDAVAFWDNRAVQHYASSDYWPQRRSMERALGHRDAAGPVLTTTRPTVVAYAAGTSVGGRRVGTAVGPSDEWATRM